MILICYDGSDDAKAAIQLGGRLLSGHKAIVLTVWHPFRSVSGGTPGGFGMSVLADVEKFDRTSAETANRCAQEGALLAGEAGFDAEPTARSIDRSIPDGILSTADALDATAILMGSRGLTGLKSLLLGSVSHRVIQHADRAVIVVPSPEVARSRTHIRNATEERTKTV